MNEIYKELIYLAYCSVNGIIPDKKRTENINLEQLYAVSKHLTLVSLIAFALESADIQDSRFEKAKEKAMRKNLFLDTERKALFAYFENKGIWYMPLKGSILKDIYPEYGMRQMADNDILYDVTYQEDVKSYFESKGYEISSYKKGVHDVYKKPPVLNFEMHSSLFGVMHDLTWQEYYSNVKNKLIKDTDNKYGYHFSDDDFYIYITTHEYKHYSNGGTGLRSLVDRYVFIKNKVLNWNYIESECQKLGIAEFEKESRKLALNLFGFENGLTESDETRLKMLDVYLHSGTYGLLENSIKKGLDTSDGSKIKYFMSRVFPSMSYYQTYFPILYKFRMLIPFFIVYRFFKVIICRRKMLKNYIRILCRI